VKKKKKRHSQHIFLSYGQLIWTAIRTEYLVCCLPPCWDSQQQNLTDTAPAMCRHAK